jgi:hypothetical protein
MVISVESGKGRFNGNMNGVYYVQNPGLCLEFPLKVVEKETKREKEKRGMSKIKTRQLYTAQRRGRKSRQKRARRGSIFTL